jgi:hypothetical protein
MTAEEQEKLNYYKILMDNRLRSIIDTWNILKSSPMANTVTDLNRFTLNRNLAIRSVISYISNLESLKVRCGIPDKAQTTKVAGLIASAILKFRPIVPTDPNDKDIGESDANEILAIYQGINLCCNLNGLHEKEGSDLTEINKKRRNFMKSLMEKRSFKDWHKKFIYLLKEQNYTSESLIMLFETLCLMFPDEINPAHK